MSIIVKEAYHTRYLVPGTGIGSKKVPTKMHRHHSGSIDDDDGTGEMRRKSFDHHESKKVACAPRTTHAPIRDYDVTRVSPSSRPAPRLDNNTPVFELQ